MFERSRRLERAIVLAGLTSLVLAPAVRAQGAVGLLPPAKEIIARYAAAVGGDAWKKHKSARMKASMEVAGMSATMEVGQIFGTGVIQTMNMPGMGETKGGYDGTMAWSVSPNNGPQILTGKEAEQMKEDVDPDNGLRLSANIVSTETIEKTTVNGTDCYKVRITWKSGRVADDCYSIADGLLIASTTKVTTQMGEMEMTQYESDYKDFGGGVKRPSTLMQEVMGQRMTIKVTSWEWDNVVAKELEAPPEVKALVKKP